MMKSRSEMGSAFSTKGEIRNAYNILVGTLKGRGHL
jgi:hypothetical protein